jgi:hypothetical protein
VRLALRRGRVTLPIAALGGSVAGTVLAVDLALGVLLAASAKRTAKVAAGRA